MQMRRTGYSGQRSFSSCSLRHNICMNGRNERMNGIEGIENVCYHVYCIRMQIIMREGFGIPIHKEFLIMRKFFYLLATVLLGVLSVGCSMQKMDQISQVDADDSEAEDVLEMERCHFKLMEDSDLPLEDVVGECLGLSPEEAEAYRVNREGESYSYQKDGVYLTVGPMYGNPGDVLCFFLSYMDGNAEAAYRYEGLILGEAETQESFTSYLQASLREHFPEENLEQMTKAEAVSKCASFAKTFGYDSQSEVTVYALSREHLQLAACQWSETVEPGDELYVGAPDPEAEAVYRDPEIINTDRIWGLEDEAFLMIYRPKAEGVLIDWTGVDALTLIYVPAKDKVVLARGSFPIPISDRTEIEKIMTKEDAVRKIMLTNGITDAENLVIQSAELVYSSTDDLWFHNDGILDPCWRIEYQVKNIKQPER